MKAMSLMRSSRLVLSSLVACALFALLTAFAPAVRAADAENPEYKGWAAFKPGTTVKRHQVVSAAGTKQEMDLTTKLVELTADKAVVEDSIAMNVNGQAMNMPGNKRTIPAKLAGGAPVTPAKPDANAPKASMKEGEEKVDVGGKSYKCKTVETTSPGPQGQGEVKGKVWTSPEVPGGLVKMTATTTGAVQSETTLTLVSIEPAK